MAIKWNIDLVREFFKEKGLELLENEYVNSKTLMKVRDENGYLYQARVNNIKMGQKLLPFISSNPYILKNIGLYLKNYNPTSILLENKKYINNLAKLKLKCNKCNKEYERNWDEIQRTHKICPDCIKRRHDENQKIPKEYVINYFKEKGYYLYDFEYINNQTPLLCYDEFGYKYRISYNNLSKGRVPNRFSYYYNPECFIHNLNIFAKIENSKTKALEVSRENKEYIVLFKCDCGDCYYSNVTTFINKGKMLCDKCTKAISSIEKLTMCFLNDNNIDYLREYVFEDCRYKKALFFDFYLPEYNICIEVDGRQHYEEVCFGGISKEKAVNNLKIVQMRDEIKDNYCKDNNIKLIRIPYWEFKNDNYKEILKNILNIH